MVGPTLSCLVTGVPRAQPLYIVLCSTASCRPLSRQPGVRLPVWWGIHLARTLIGLQCVLAGKLLGVRLYFCRVRSQRWKVQFETRSGSPLLVTDRGPPTLGVLRGRATQANRDRSP